MFSVMVIVVGGEGKLPTIYKAYFMLASRLSRTGRDPMGLDRQRLHMTGMKP